ncbi:hypothetical protein ABZX95_20385 [Streptomyces sp. NPDC004232]|uniref:hypothetical protein n=1 Tax=Streptomyces sp. NPDC004232 TaxID=3154454 RepID=UPI001D57FE54|nr:hypothetical protein [Streptomyces sp. tea 10]
MPVFPLGPVGGRSATARRRMVTAVVVEGPGPSLDGPGLERAGRPAAQALRGGLDAEATADRVLDAASAATTM